MGGGGGGGMGGWGGGGGVSVFLNIHIYFCYSRECCDAVLLLTTKLPLTFHQHEVIRKRLTFLFLGELVL